MKFPEKFRVLLCRAFVVLSVVTFSGSLRAGPATLLFEDNFTGGIPSWTAVQPIHPIYGDGPMLWEFDPVNKAFFEQTKIYTDSTSFSTSRVAVMLINATVAPDNFTYTARLTAGDDDGFGLIWGYQNENTFYRLSFARQVRGGWPNAGWVIDRMNAGQITDLFAAMAGGFTNTQYRPFDVTITVLNNQLTVTLIDDPLGSATLYNLVTDGALPSAAGGKVGMFSWGMEGTQVRGFRVQNPALVPTPLAGDPANTVLTNWSFLIPPGGGTTTNAVAPPLWGVGLTTNGDRGAMIENSDWTANNIAAATTNFPAPSAVAGDVNWSNYVYTARVLSNDDDAWGMLLRFKNETNFYRIAFRNQNANSGVKRGISIQKNINQVYSQLFASTNFIPPVNAPIEIYAFIRGNQLQVIANANPDSDVAPRFATGPINISSGTVDTGKIGVFSWAEARGGAGALDAGLEVDYVKVQTTAGEGLMVKSRFGNPAPPVGLNDLSSNSVVNASVEDFVNVSAGIRGFCLGWDGTGSVQTNGTTNQFSFTLTNFSLINWKWRAEYQLTTNTTAGGTVSASLGPWIPEGTNVTVTATPDSGYVFYRWSGDSTSTNPVLNFAMSQPLTLTANFAVDANSDGVPDVSITSASVSGGNVTLNVFKPSISTYNVLRSTNVEGAYLPVATNQTSSTYIEPLPGSTAFYRLQLGP